MQSVCYLCRLLAMKHNWCMLIVHIAKKDEYHVNVTRGILFGQALRINGVSLRHWFIWIALFIVLENIQVIQLATNLTEAVKMVLFKKCQHSRSRSVTLYRFHHIILQWSIEISCHAHLAQRCTNLIHLFMYACLLLYFVNGIHVNVTHMNVCWKNDIVIINLPWFFMLDTSAYASPLKCCYWLWYIPSVCTV